MTANEALIHSFYATFQKRDAATMKSCYHPEVHFHDPAFQDLHGAEVGAMWQMLIERGGDMTLNFSDVKANENEGSATWVAHYTFSLTGRPVQNHIHAHFRFADGQIIDHRDEFDFDRWLKMAFGWKWILFKLPPVRQKFHQRLRTMLNKFITRNFR
ncbi:MAG: nuclear transport factor 2 family protein [Cyclobacteriaceae bacterium]